MEYFKVNNLLKLLAEGVIESILYISIEYTRVGNTKIARQRGKTRKLNGTKQRISIASSAIKKALILGLF